jgi:hypothetical protein
MAIAVYIHPQTMSPAQYDEVHRRLEAVGSARPKGRLHHSAFGGESVMVYDVWESQEDFDAFAAIVMPIVAEVGVSMEGAGPDVMPVHNLIQ